MKGEGGGGCMGNPREISTRTCNGESAFLADGSDVDDAEGGGRKIKGGKRKCGRGVKNAGKGDKVVPLERRRRVGAGSLGPARRHWPDVICPFVHGDSQCGPRDNK